ncbi:nucleotidyltransferase family protein [Aliarcobacter cryaerophilus]|uniref:nucleotidyltransferase family protein n=1 Tax=Aliarcobacter cryaerophilus TaxID=28198 RepID=UPI00082D1F1C|nr:nucleotidyltransferase family protein [Aliarcobacter cryaerophilus]MCT7465769.1 nucleotidyltransferase family protein [Aliarcobacter cryaerophilus]MCT7493564.1 nucleotidyltransferase family protein [Aliarcobacter cryaerophilus]MCT7519504.1 nucleotidyltransferase family protein [Aliarcobacter cryaerophilus]MCT7541782.1 nucleotidyltransferase family protein [Aliarcobacter cryaerophilus]MCT7545082.1 nucleotidyltransferase family protein [Aliarcobacter cryaerophilus]
MSKQIDKTNILNYLKEHYSEFKNKYNVEKIGLFGSYARDEATENSDIDIFVKMKPSLFDMVAIKEQIENDLNRKVDIIREHKNIKPIFLKMIKKDLIYA